jgi:hypothetical protein
VLLADPHAQVISRRIEAGIRIDADARTLDVLIDENELARRRTA